MPTEADEGSSVEFISQTLGHGSWGNFAPPPTSSQLIGGNHRSGATLVIWWTSIGAVKIHPLVSTFTILGDIMRHYLELWKNVRVMFGITFLLLLLAALTLFTPKNKRSLVKETPFLATFEDFIFIGPESDHWLCLSLTHWLTDSLTHCCLVNLIDVTLACEDGNWKLVEVVTVLDVDSEKQFTP